jgi:multidrug efflux pump
MSHFFIDRPVFAWVVALIIMLVGGVTVLTLPIGQYPRIAPPPITINATYPGASAEAVRDTVIQPIEQEMYGLDGLEYMSSNGQADGSMQITLTFRQGTDPNIAQVQVQNKLSLAQPLLPQEVLAQGLAVTKATKNFMMIIGFISTDRSMDEQAIGDYVASNIEGPVSRISGVGDYTLFGAEYSMRVWLHPAKLNSFGLTVVDVSQAINNQNIQVSSGEIGGLPALKEQRLDATIKGPSRLNTPEQFEKILLKVNPDGSQVRLKDVAKVELGGQVYEPRGGYNGQPSAGLGINLAPGANQLQVANAIHAELKALQPYFPHGFEAVFPYDTSPYVILSLQEVVQTLLIAMGLVILIMYVFLQNVRATLIPALAVPVVLLGTFAVLGAMGFIINTLTLLAMVLAIGLLVDDAIVVVENVERLMADEGLSPKEAARASMNQITGALVGIALVLSAVFLPMAFFSGSAGVIYRQFSVTIISAMAISLLVAVVFTPALCATLLKPVAPGSHGTTRGFFGWFNRTFDKSAGRYKGAVSLLIRHVRPAMLIYVGLVALAGYLFHLLPGGFMPDEDQQTIFVQTQLPPGATAEMTEKVNDDVRAYFLDQEKDAVKSVFTVMGFHFGGRAQNAGFAAVGLKDFDHRPNAAQSAQEVTRRALAHFANYSGAIITPFLPPAVMELGNATGFDFELEDRGHLGHQALVSARNQLLELATKDQDLVAVRPNGLEDAPQAALEIDREKAYAMGVSMADINTTVEGSFGSLYVNEFTREGRTKRVFIQGMPESRMQTEDLRKWYVRNNLGNMVPLSSFVHVTWSIGAQKLERYNGVESVELLGEPAPGVSTGQAMATVEKYAATLPKGVGYEWTSVSYEQQQSAGQAGNLYLISIIVVLLCLAALYESWTIPVAVLLIVPLGALGSAAGSLIFGLENDIYFQVGLLTTVGLATKNAILIVEFAKEAFEKGSTLADAAVHAARERLRPILMTSLAFIFGTLPLAIASSAGAGAHVAIGVAVVGGMIGATVFAIFFVPVFFVIVLHLFRVKPKSLAAPSEPALMAPAPQSGD